MCSYHLLKSNKLLQAIFWWTSVIDGKTNECALEHCILLINVITMYISRYCFYWLSSSSAEIKLLEIGSITLQLFHFQILIRILHLSNKCNDDKLIFIVNKTKLKIIDYKEWLYDSIPCFHGLERNIQTKTF